MPNITVRLTSRLIVAISIAFALAFAFALAPAVAHAQAPGSLVQLGESNSCISSDGESECPTTNGEGLAGSEDVAVSPDGQNVYVLGADDDAIAEFGRNDDGSLSEAGCIADSSSEGGCDSNTATGLVDPDAIVISPDGNNVYVAATDSHDIGTIAEFARDPETGLLTQLSPNACIAENLNETDDVHSDCSNQTGHGIEAPDGLAVSPDGQNVYAVSENGDDIAEFARNSNGSLTQLNGGNDCIQDANEESDDCASSANGISEATGVLVSPDGADVYTSGFENNDGETGTIAEFARNGDGSLSQLASPNNCIETPDADDGCGSSAIGVTGVSGLAISPDGQNVYTASEFEGGPIAEFARNGDGSLTQLASPNNCIEEAGSNQGCGSSAQGIASGWELKVSPDGLDVYAAAPSDECGDSCQDVAEFARSSDGSLTQLASPDDCIQDTSQSDGEECGTESGLGLGGPGLAISPDGANVYVTGNDDDIAEFDRTPAEHTLNVSLAGTGSGGVSDGTGAIECPDSCSHTYPADTEVTLTATASPGSTFTGWSSGPCEGTGTCQVTMSSDTQVTATFTANPPPSQATLTVSPAGTGSGTVSDGTGGISCPSTCSHAYATNTQVTLTETPGGGSTFAGWSGACLGTGTCQVTMSSDMQVTATFTAPPTPPAPGSPTPVLTSAPSTVTDAGAAFLGTVDPDGLATTAYFQYGLDKRYSQVGASGPNYTSQTPAQTVGSDFATHGVGPIGVTGLVPDAVYHVRLVATNSAGTTFGADVTFTTAAAPPPGSPTLGETFNIEPVSGLVLVASTGTSCR